MRPVNGRRLGLLASVSAAVLFGAVAARAAGTTLVEQGTGAVASATADETTAADPSVAYYNPAGMVLIDGTEVEGGLVFADINSSFYGHDNAIRGTSASLFNNYATGFELSTLYGDSFAVTSLPYGVKAGLTITVPNGGREKYNGNFTGSPQGDEANITDVNIGLPFAVDLGHGLSVGFAPSLDWYQAIVGLNQNAAIGTISANSFAYNGTGVPGQVHGQSFAFGFDAGVMYQLSPDTRFGLNYRSKIVHRIKGVELIDLGNGALGQYLPNVPVSGGTETWTVPQQISFGVFQQLTPEWAVMANATWENWSSVHALLIDNPQAAYLTGTGTPNGITPSYIYEPWHFRDTWTIGGAVQYSPALLGGLLTLTSGVGYDETPVRTPYRIDLLPDNNRFMIGFGYSYQLLPFAKVSGAYGHYFINGAASNNARQVLTTAGGKAVDSGSGTLTGQYKLGANIFSTGLTLSF